MILVAEDDPVVQQLIAKQLEKLGFIKHLIVGNGKVVLEHVDSCCMVLMDLNMPVLDGLTATKEIRRRESEQGKVAIPVVAVTGISDRKTCIEAGMSDFLQKPVSLGTLKAALERWLPAACDCCTDH